jgi:RimJ/RimL family protein N-acetyltransferase
MVTLPWTPDYPIETERLVLRPHRDGDLEDLMRYHSDPDVVRYIPWPVRDEQQTREALAKRTAQGEVLAEGQWLVLAIELPGRADGPSRVIGEVLLKYDSEEHRRGELGYAMAADVQGNGYAAEAARAVLALAFDRFGLHRVIAVLDGRNTASARLLERIGMRLEARHVSATWFKDEWTDDLIYAITEDEWRVRARS